MDYSYLTPAHMRKIEGLLESRILVQSAIDALDKQIEAEIKKLMKGEETSAQKAPRRAVVGRRPRFQLREAILAILRGAGAGGAPVNEIATAVGATTQQVHAWFHNTGKRVPGIRKVGVSRYSLLTQE